MMQFQPTATGDDFLFQLGIILAILAVAVILWKLVILPDLRNAFNRELREVIRDALEDRRVDALMFDDDALSGSTDRLDRIG